MIYRGYELTRVPYKPPCAPATTAAAVVGPDGRTNLVADPDVGRHVVDAMVKHGFWPDREPGWKDLSTEGIGLSEPELRAFVAVMETPKQVTT